MPAATCYSIWGLYTGRGEHTVVLIFSNCHFTLLPPGPVSPVPRGQKVFKHAW